MFKNYSSKKEAKKDDVEVDDLFDDLLDMLKKAGEAVADPLDDVEVADLLDGVEVDDLFSIEAEVLRSVDNGETKNDNGETKNDNKKVLEKNKKVLAIKQIIKNLKIEQLIQKKKKRKKKE